jgi:hypothetical protein
MALTGECAWLSLDAKDAITAGIFRGVERVIP